MSDSTASQAQGGTCASGGRFRYVRWAAALTTGTALLVTVTAVLLPSSRVLYREDGVLEDLSVVCWVLSGLAALWAVVRAGGRESRLMAAWTGWVATLAALRELDAHILLNPQHLGAWGVRYRLDWWTNGSVSVWLKLGWGAVFLAALVLVAYPPLRLLRILSDLFWKGDALAGLLVLSVAFLVFGFVIDDILRPVRFVRHDAKQLIEETSEAIGAILFSAGMVLQWRRPLGMRLREAGFTTERASGEARIAGAAGRRPGSDGRSQPARTSRSSDEGP